MDLIAEVKEQFGQIGTILSGDPGYKCPLHGLILPETSARIYRHNGATATSPRSVGDVRWAIDREGQGRMGYEGGGDGREGLAGGRAKSRLIGWKGTRTKLLAPGMRWWALGLALTMMAVTPSCSENATGPRWIIPSSSLIQMRRLPGFEEARSYLSRSLTDIACYVPLDNCRRIKPATWRGGLLLVVMNRAKAVSAIGPLAGDLEGVEGIVYDTDSWDLTPLVERRTLPTITGEIARLAHGRGLKMISAPGIGLLRTLRPRVGDVFSVAGFRAFLELQLIGALAKQSDVVVLQSQGLSADAVNFKWFVQEAAEQARRANPRVEVIALLDTSVRGRRVSASQLSQVVSMTRSIVDGYWLHISGPSRRCPSCGPAYPEVGIDLFRQLADSD